MTIMPKSVHWKSIVDEVLVRIPSKQRKLIVEWEGPYRITNKVSSVDHEVETPGKGKEKKMCIMLIF